MTLRYLPPAYSPLRFSSVLAAAGAALRGAGPAHAALIESLRARFPAAHDILLTDSGTSALTLALGLGRRLHGDAPVAMPAYSCYDLATAAIGADTRVCFYDLVPETLEPEWSSLRAALEHGARTVVAAHLFGYPVDMPALLGLARSYGAMVIEDAAQALGAELNGKPVGGWGHLTVLSFGRGKGVTGGRGGALLLNDPGMGAGVLPNSIGATTANRSPTGVLLVAALWALPRPLLYGIPARLPFLGLGETVFRAPHPPTTLSAPASAAATDSLRLSVREVGIRRDQARWLREQLITIPMLQCVNAPDARAACLRFPVILKAGQADEIVRRGRAMGVARGYPKALPDLAQLTGRISGNSGLLAGARTLAAGLVTLPTHSLQRESDRARLVSWLRAELGNAGARDSGSERSR